MEMVFCDESDEISMVNDDPQDVSTKDATLQGHSGEDSKVTAAQPGARKEKKTSCRVAALFLGVLCLLLLIGLKILCSQFTHSNSEREMEMVLLHTSCNNLTEERDQLQNSYNDLITERHQLENNLTRQRDQLQNSYNDLITERHQLENNLTRQRDQLQTSNNLLAREKDQLQERFEGLTKDRNDLQTKLRETEAILKNLTEERADLKRILNNFGWVYFRGRFYHVSSTKKTWQQSREDCLRNGADLLIINSKEEQDFANGFKKYMWIGLTDSEREGTWKWVDGTQMTKSYWSSGEPNGAKGENCVDIKNHNAENSWNDESCSVSLFWICEKKVLP